MPLREENRILVRHGLELMKQTQNVGLHALMEVNQILPWQDGKLGAFHIGFVLGPCLNASGVWTARSARWSFGQQNKRSCGSAGSIFEAVKRQPERNDGGICQNSGRDDRIRSLKGRPCSGCFPAGLP